MLPPAPHTAYDVVCEDAYLDSKLKEGEGDGPTKAMVEVADVAVDNQHLLLHGGQRVRPLRQPVPPPVNVGAQQRAVDREHGDGERVHPVTCQARHHLHRQWL